ncbi:hypothetical protein BJ166DRAFT_597011 [Pestalotiopsis sp. NC0098]|nr:hypothetical protein BJ166DRAFT_597011 [Pestalotiopsis sp. NC0098]
MPVQSKLVLSASDHFFFRLNKLLAPTKDLGSILTTFNYALYLLAWLDGKAHNLKSKALHIVSAESKLMTTIVGSAQAEASPFAKLGSVLSNTRATLRLVGLLPIYVKVRKLLADKDNDAVLRAIGLVQCAFFGTYQALENIAFLTDHGILSHKHGHSRWTHGGPNTSITAATMAMAAAGPSGMSLRVAGLYKIAHRAWFLGIMCDFARLMREAQIFFRRNHLEKEDITPEEAERAAHWYYDWIRPLAWLPIGWQLSAWSEQHEYKALNLGFQGIAGVLADLKQTASLWHATENVVD